ncbi:3-deoxy-7-phosphoheptulonate synthase [Streptomyces sp. O3]
MTSTTPGLKRTAAQQPEWPSEHAVAQVREELAALPPLVDAPSCDRLRAELARAARGEAFVLQGGDCAEPFADSAPDRIGAKAAQLTGLAELAALRSGLPTVRIGRFAGQYAKPRSQRTETLADGTVLPVYRGDAVNAAAADPAARRADPARLRAAYDHAARCLDALFLDGCLPSAPRTPDTGSAPLFTSHEALLLDLEEPLVRTAPSGQGRYASSAHLLWIGERTRQLDGRHIEFARSVSNPVGVKLGPDAAPSDVRELCQLLARGRPPGRLVLISRMGADLTTSRLPALVEAAAPFAGQVVWLCDPMHGNTVRHVSGRKTRVLTDMLREVEDFHAVLRAHAVPPGGLHLEMTCDDVTECVDEHPALTVPDALPRYTSDCDPRLDAVQARRVVEAAAAQLRRKDADA